MRNSGTVSKQSTCKPTQKNTTFYIRHKPAHHAADIGTLERNPDKHPLNKRPRLILKPHPKPDPCYENMEDSASLECFRIQGLFRLQNLASQAAKGS